MPTPDEKILKSLSEGDTDALDELYRRYAKPLYVFVNASMNIADPEDVVHDVFLKVIRSAGKFNPKKAAFKTWLFRIAKNHCIDLIRHESKLKIVEIDKDDPVPVIETIADDVPSIDDSISEAEIFRALKDCIDELKKEEERQALLLYHIAGKVYREIGEIFEKSISMVKKLIDSAGMKVRKCLELKGIDSYAG